MQGSNLRPLPCEGSLRGLSGADLPMTLRILAGQSGPDRTAFYTTVYTKRGAYLLGCDCAKSSSFRPLLRVVPNQ